MVFERIEEGNDEFFYVFVSYKRHLISILVFRIVERFVKIYIKHGRI